MQHTPIICDPGTGYMKMGFAGDNFPKATFSSLIGRPMLRCNQQIGDGVILKDIMIGNQASKYRSILQLSHPTQQGYVNITPLFFRFCNQIVSQIGISNPQGLPVFLTQPIMNPTSNKVGMLELMFEKFGVGHIKYGLQAIMSLYAEGITTALLLDSGDGVTHCIPIFEGNLLKHACQRLDIAGRHVTSYLIRLLQMKGYALNSTSDFQTVRQIKQKHCFVSGDFRVDNKMALETTIHDKYYDLPDGQRIKIGRQRFQAPQILFDPAVAGMQKRGCGEMIFKSIGDCATDLKKHFYNSILISGGTSMMPGFPTRIKSQIQSIFEKKVSKGAQTSIKFKVLDSPVRKYNVFIGASLSADLAKDYPQYWASKKDYDQKGKKRLADELSKM